MNTNLVEKLDYMNLIHKMYIYLISQSKMLINKHILYL